MHSSRKLRTLPHRRAAQEQDEPALKSWRSLLPCTPEPHHRCMAVGERHMEKPFPHLELST